MTSPTERWQPCGVHNSVYDIRCIRPAGHEGKHRGTYMEPKKVWWPGAKEKPQWAG